MANLFDLITGNFGPTPAQQQAANQQSQEVSYNMAAGQGKVAGPIDPRYKFAPKDPSGVLGASSSAGLSGNRPLPSSAPTQDYSSFARQAADSELSSLNTQYDQNRESLLSQLGSLDTQKNQSLSALDTQLAGVKNTIANQRTQAQQSTDSQIEQAGNTARNTQRQNRNVLRALGILNSSAAGELMSKPLNQFDQIRGQLGIELQNRFTQLDDYLDQRVAEHQHAYQSVVSQYNDLVGKIQSDLRFNERQRGDAVKAANAALSQRIYEIQQSAQQYQQAVDLQKQQYSSAANSLSQYNPSYDTSLLTATQIAPQQQSSNAQIYGAPQKKQGLLSSIFG